MKLPRDFYQREDVLAISRELLGKVLCSSLDGTVTRVVITETEAYAGVEDRASHAFGNRRTRRTEPMFGAGGIAYVYLCYGIHHLFNVVTAGEGVPHAVLVRASTPLEGHEIIARRRGMPADDRRLLAGPGSLARGLGITTALTGESLLGKRVWIEDRGIEVADEAIRSGPRVGVDYAGEDALLPYRFRLNSQSN
ncbi:MAG: DNA-3-methyladenine glycosylase [Woeseiaceae bacterium]|jgi:DNA-3-methyladenine glycosylase|nr:DNA-3-methyladenine glycosylase [Woeseiaceae bacterium]